MFSPQKKIISWWGNGYVSQLDWIFLQCVHRSKYHIVLECGQYVCIFIIHNYNLSIKIKIMLYNIEFWKMKKDV